MVHPPSSIISFGGNNSTNEDNGNGESSSSAPSAPKPVVFAFTVTEAGKKGVKFYKTWRANRVRYVY
jgi:hypothetical protein